MTTKEEKNEEQFLTGASVVVKGYSRKAAEMKYDPAGRPVTNCIIGCGGTPSIPLFWLDVEGWDTMAEALNELVLEKGIKVIAEGKLRENVWHWQGKRYSRFKVIYLTSLNVEVDGVWQDIGIPEKHSDGIPESVKERAYKEGRKKRKTEDQRIQKG